MNWLFLFRSVLLGTIEAPAGALAPGRAAETVERAAMALMLPLPVTRPRTVATSRAHTSVTDL
ncbi:hypothetical protein GCM10010329_34840 [Streptomyces spiroverticillatus]|uniref:Uncharacterized protein n=1 Tax=Streptomyces finlayi TaxID=67296 RepID=A0A918WWY2_9ACTN|nr:hypothetical protein GCM10010329_34840 [Streptomyces spiroverticillatus]GHC91817.1 hypothetical protein GCM10010334_27250 [Streptomyces finlayi]